MRALLIARFAELVLPELSDEKRENAEHTALYQKISNDVQREFDGYFKENKTARASGYLFKPSLYLALVLSRRFY